MKRHIFLAATLVLTYVAVMFTIGIAVGKLA
jgi:hypothetical protein